MKKDMTAMLKMFNLIDIGECAGSGIPNIFRVWREQGWAMPDITEQLEPERTILTLKFGKAADKKSAINVKLVVTLRKNASPQTGKRTPAQSGKHFSLFG